MIPALDVVELKMPSLKEEQHWTLFTNSPL
jgi:hypothetical protein